MPVWSSGTYGVMYGGNPIVFTSGVVNQYMPDLMPDQQIWRVERLHWLTPDQTSTSSLFVTKGRFSQSAQIYVESKCDASGVSQILNFGDLYWDRPQITVPTGKLYVYLDIVP